jgi:hypothetical protein
MLGQSATNLEDKLPDISLDSAEKIEEEFVRPVSVLHDSFSFKGNGRFGEKANIENVSLQNCNLQGAVLLDTKWQASADSELRLVADIILNGSHDEVINALSGTVYDDNTRFHSIDSINNQIHEVLRSYSSSIEAEDIPVDLTPLNNTVIHSEQFPADSYDGIDIVIANRATDDFRDKAELLIDDEETDSSTDSDDLSIAASCPDESQAGIQQATSDVENATIAQAAIADNDDPLLTPEQDGSPTSGEQNLIEQTDVAYDPWSDSSSDPDAAELSDDKIVIAIAGGSGDAEYPAPFQLYTQLLLAPSSQPNEGEVAQDEPTDTNHSPVIGGSGYAQEEAEGEKPLAETDSLIKSSPSDGITLELQPAHSGSSDDLLAADDEENEQQSVANLQIVTSPSKNPRIIGIPATATQPSVPPLQGAVKAYQIGSPAGSVSLDSGNLAAVQNTLAPIVSITALGTPNFSSFEVARQQVNREVFSPRSAIYSGGVQGVSDVTLAEKHSELVELRELFATNPSKQTRNKIMGVFEGSSASELKALRFLLGSDWRGKSEGSQGLGLVAETSFNNLARDYFDYAVSGAQVGSALGNDLLIRRKLIGFSERLLDLVAEAACEDQPGDAAQSFNRLMQDIDMEFSGTGELAGMEEAVCSQVSGADPQDSITNFRVNNRYMRCCYEAIERLKPTLPEQGQRLVDTIKKAFLKRGYDSSLPAVSFASSCGLNDALKIPNDDLENVGMTDGSSSSSFVIADGVIKFSERLAAKSEFQQLFSDFCEACEEGATVNGGIQAGGVLDLVEAQGDVAFVGSLKGRANNLELILSSADQGGRSIIERVQSGDLTLVFGGNYFGQDGQENTLSEHINSLVTLQQLMQLKTAFPKSVFLMAGAADVMAGSMAGVGFFDTMQEIYGINSSKLGAEGAGSPGLAASNEPQRGIIERYFSDFVGQLALGAEGRGVGAYPSTPPLESSLNELARTYWNEDVFSVYMRQVQNQSALPPGDGKHTQQTNGKKQKQSKTNKSALKNAKAIEAYFTLKPSENEGKNVFTLAEVTSFAARTPWLGYDPIILLGSSVDEQILELPFPGELRLYATSAAGDDFGFLMLRGVDGAFVVEPTRILNELHN